MIFLSYLAIALIAYALGDHFGHCRAWAKATRIVTEGEPR